MRSRCLALALVLLPLARARAEPPAAPPAAVAGPRWELRLVGARGASSGGFGDGVLARLARRAGKSAFRLFMLEALGVGRYRLRLGLYPWAASCCTPRTAVALGSATEVGADGEPSTPIVVADVPELFVGSVLTRAMHFGVESAGLASTSPGVPSIRVHPYFTPRAGGITARGRF